MHAHAIRYERIKNSAISTLLDWTNVCVCVCVDPFINSKSSILDEFASFELQIICNEPNRLTMDDAFGELHLVVYGFRSNQILVASLLLAGFLLLLLSFYI